MSELLRCPCCRAVVASAELKRHVRGHSTLQLLRTVWGIDRWFTALTVALYLCVMLFLLAVVMVSWP